MTQSEKYQIEIFRAQGIGYTEIAKKMGISVNSIKTYCRRHDLGGKRGYEAAGPINVCACENCGKPVIQNAGRKSDFAVISAAMNSGTHIWSWLIEKSTMSLFVGTAKRLLSHMAIGTGSTVVISVI